MIDFLSCITRACVIDFLSWRAPAIGHTGWRTEGPKELEACVKRLEACGAGVGWQKPVVGHGAAYRFRAPGGQLHEVFWESERLSSAPRPGTDRAQSSAALHYFAALALAASIT